MMKKVLFVIALALSAALGAQNVPNPVIKGVADAGCIRWAGKYYLGGVATYGDFYVSDNLTEWPERVHVFDLDNEWTHGTGAKNNQIHSDDILYHNGLFHLLFSVNYWGSDRHIVHITHATSPTPTGPFVEKRSDQWMENRIDPHVFTDEDGRMYLYMVKFTDGNTIWMRPLDGDFAFSGDAMQAFSSQHDTWETQDNRVAEGPFVIKHHGRYYMMYNANHTAAEYGNYRLGVCEAEHPMQFNPGGKYAHPVVVPQTEQVSDRYPDLLRYGSGKYSGIDLQADTIRFTLSSPLRHNAYLKVAQRGGVRIEVGGQVVNPAGRDHYEVFPLDKALLCEGENVLVVHRPQDNTRAQLVALALYDAAEDLAGEMLLTPGQPNIVRGPNGWEWWLVYMANQGWRRHQFVNRIHFVNGRMTVDGITDAHTAGAHPLPARPTYAGRDLSAITFADSYLLELTLATRRPDGGAVTLGGHTLRLPETLSAAVPHLWRIEKDGTRLSAWVDGILIADAVKVRSKGTPALSGSSASYDIQHITYTEGFDRWGQHRFAEWPQLKANAAGLQLTQGTYLHKGHADAYELSVAFDRLPLGQSGRAGVYAAYLDAQNYVRLVFDMQQEQLVVEECRQGITLATAHPLQQTAVRFPYLAGTDGWEKQYRLDHPTRLSSLYLPHLDVAGDLYAQGTKDSRHVDDLATLMRIQWLDGRTWRDLDCTVVPSERPDWQKLQTAPVLTTALRFVNRAPHDNASHIYRIRTEETMRAAYQLRIRREKGTLQVHLGNQPLTTIALPWIEPTQVGLYSGSARPVLVPDMLFYLL